MPPLSRTYTASNVMRKPWHYMDVYPGEVANPARGQLNKENGHFPVPVRV